MKEDKIVALSIAGFDPSAGAGILADIKTFESAGVYGLGVCSSITYQNDLSFERVDWLSKEQIAEQFDILAKRFKIRYVKIGLVENLDTLLFIISHLKTYNRTIKIVWDPILKSSTGFEFHVMFEEKHMKDIYKQLALITPNREEIRKLVSHLSEAEGARHISRTCPVLLKGGHAAGDKSTDILYEKKEEHYYYADRIPNGTKHGSGCVLSAAITAELAKGEVLHVACEKAKLYMNSYLASSETLLGFHYKNNVYAG